MRATIAGLFLFPSLLAAEVIETAQISTVLSYLEKSDVHPSVVVCDLDNTLIRSTRYLGSIMWGDYVINHLVGKGVPKRQAEEVEHILWEAIQPHTEVQLVEPNSSRTVVEEIQQLGIPLVGLTSRSPSESTYTIAQLRSVSLDFAKQDHSWGGNQILKTEPAAAYHEGVLFGTPFNLKSEVLFNFLDKNGVLPKILIFVDDKWSHVFDIEQACRSRGIRYIGIRYSGADDWVREFDPSIAEAQWKAFPTQSLENQAST